MIPTNLMLLSYILKINNIYGVSACFPSSEAKILIGNPSFHIRNNFNDNLMTLEMTKSDLIFNKPLFINIAILYLSKIWFYGLFINVHTVNL